MEHPTTQLVQCRLCIVHKKSTLELIQTILVLLSPVRCCLHCIQDINSKADANHLSDSISPVRCEQKAKEEANDTEVNTDADQKSSIKMLSHHH